jgi:hypothetical protein
MITIINKKDYPLGQLPDGEPIYRGASPLANPWSHQFGSNAKLVKTREEAIQNFKWWLLDQLKRETPAKKEIMRLVGILEKTGTLVLICNCVPLRCHGQIIATVVQYYLELRRKI